MLGIDLSYTSFDDELIMYINSAFTTLNQLGIGKKGYSITSSSNVWTEFIEDLSNYQSVKMDVYLRVRQVFDPPTSSSVLDSISKLISEYDWRLMINSELDSE